MLAMLLVTLSASAAPDAWPDRYPGQATPEQPHYDLKGLYAKKRFEEGYSRDGHPGLDAKKPEKGR
ncbi:MAG: hypothetical protein AAF211_10410 [Myxococcota bacterium]